MTSGISASYMSSAFEGVASAFSKRMQKKTESPKTAETDIVAAAKENEMLDTSGMYKPQDAMLYSTNPSMSEMAMYWSVPSCMGVQLLPEVGSSSAQRTLDNKEGYKELQSMIAERQQDVKDTYGLNGLTQPEFYMKTTGKNAVEMTDHFYNGFNDRGKELIKEFFPFIAENYGW